MSRPIDADALIANLKQKYCGNCCSLSSECDCSLIDDIKDINSMPTIDAIEVVRCKDCQYGHVTEILGETCWYCGLTGYFNTEDGYCDKGAKRNGQDDEGKGVNEK